MNSSLLIFISLVFVTVFFLMFALFMPVFGENGGSRKRLRERLNRMAEDIEIPTAVKLLREDKLGKLSPAERLVETSKLLDGLRFLICQSGHQILAYRFILLSGSIGLACGLLVWLLAKMWLLAIGAFLFGSLILYYKLILDRAHRMARFEEQLPEAIDVMRRALQAGHPFNESLHLVGEELDDPIKKEFSITFAELNYGNNMKWALLGLLERTQSVNVMALVTSVLVQRETGGNLAEILSNLSTIIRGRFRFHRKVKTLSAEGRMSAWILGLVPFALIALIQFTTPSYLTILFNSDFGIKLCIGAFIAMMIGMLWIRKIIRIEV